MFIGAAADDPGDLRFPAGAHGLDENGIACLPIIPAKIIDLMPRLMKLETFACKIEQGRYQPAGVSFITPDEHRQHGVAALSFVEPVILIAGAVVHTIAVDELEVLDEQMTPGVIH